MNHPTTPETTMFEYKVITERDSRFAEMDMILEHLTTSAV